jgi:hypothetical protein
MVQSNKPKMILPCWWIVDKDHGEHVNSWGVKRYRNKIHSVWHNKSKADRALAQLQEISPEMGFRIEEHTYETYRDLSEILD